MRRTKTNQEPADGWLPEARYLAGQGAFVTYDTEDLTVAELLTLDESVSHLGGGELDWNEPKTEMGLRVLPREARMLL